MKKCPVCNNRLNDQSTCRRCKTDLSLLVEVEKEAIIQRELALKAYEKKQFSKMFAHAKRSAALINTSESQRLLAGAAVLVQRYDLAHQLWKKQVIPRHHSQETSHGLK